MDPVSRKRPAQDLEPLVDKDTATAKRACSETAPVSVHLTLLEELCDLEGEDAAPYVEISASNSSTQEDLVAEMMKSLEKVLEVSDTRGLGEVSSAQAPSSPVSTSQPTAAFDFTWTNEEPPTVSVQNPCFNGDHGEVEDFKEDAHIRHLLQASDDELGIPLSSSSSELDESTFQEQWASLGDECADVGSYNWLDTSFGQFEEASSFSRELFEPVILF